MAFASGRVSFRRYRISGPQPKKLDDALVKRFQEHVFGSSRTVSPDGIETGWIAPTHVFDTQITAGKIRVGRFGHAAMRLDRTNAPPAVVRSYRHMEESAARESSGKQALSKEERRQAAEAADARAQKEARRGGGRSSSAGGSIPPGSGWGICNARARSQNNRSE